MDQTYHTREDSSEAPGLVYHFGFQNKEKMKKSQDKAVSAPTGEYNQPYTQLSLVVRASFVAHPSIDPSREA